MTTITEPGDSTQVQKDIAHLRELLKNTPDQGTAEIERYLKSQGATPVGPATEPDKPMFGSYDPPAKDSTGGIDWPALETKMKDNALNSTQGFAAWEGAGVPLAKGALGLAKKFPGATVGFLKGGIPGAVRGAFGKDVLSKILGGGAEAAAPAVEAPAKAVSEIVAPGEISQSVVNDPLYDKLLSKGFAESGQAAARSASGNNAMAEGINNLTPRAPNPLSFEEAMNAAGSAGARETAGNADMAQGIANLQPDKMPLNKAMSILSKGMPGAGKLGGMGAAMGMASPQDEAAQSLQGFGSMGQQPPMPPPLSSNVGEAKMMATQMIGQPKQLMEQELSMKYDPATVKFVLAAMPNRLPQ